MIAATSIQCIDIYENVVEPDIPMKSENFKITEYPMKANVEDKTGITFKGKSEECLEGHSQLFSFLKAVKSEQLIIGEKGFKIIEQPKDEKNCVTTIISVKKYNTEGEAALKIHKPTL